MTPDFPAVLRIGELSRRLGVSAHALRAWERRYGPLHPQRSASGARMSSQAAEGRVRRMQAQLARGLSAAEAARAALDEDQATPADVLDHIDEGRVARPEGLAETVGALTQALDALDEPAAQAVLDRLLAEFTVETVLRDVVLPYLHELGERWQRGTVSVAQEHFASHCCAGALPAWPGAGAPATGRRRCSPAPPATCTTG